MSIRPEDWPRVREVFEAALAVEPAERRAYLTAACGADAAVFAAVEELLASHDRSGHFLETLGDFRTELASEPMFLEEQRVGAYEVVSRLGAGGMGEVYRARDTKLNRDVALKVLPGLFGADADRLARFEREAQMLAALNHPNIATIYGVEESIGPPALVLELVEGPTVADLIARGPIPLDTALGIAQQIAEALEAAHEKGIVHRDLKPANVKITPKGTVKLLDFGIAKMIDDKAVDRTVSPRASLAADGTRDGQIFGTGTVAYMSPEQARGHPVDARTDIWAFGCVLYELLTGRRAFAGSRVPETPAAIEECEPDWKALPIDTRRSVRELLQRCLQKDVARRLQHIGEARALIENERQRANTGNRPPHLRRVLRWIPIAIAAATIAFVVASRSTLPPEPTAPIPFATEADVQAMPRWSPGGNRIAYVAAVDSVLQVFTKSLTSAKPTQITHEVTACLNPVWSADGTHIYYLTGTRPNSRLRSVAATGGPSDTVLNHVSQADVSPDGKTLVVLIYDAAGRYRLAFSSPPGAPPRPYTEPPLAEISNSGINTYLRFDPSGRYLGVSMVRAGRNEFWRIPMDGEAPQELLHGGRSGGRFTWLHQGDGIIGDSVLGSTPYHLAITEWSSRRLRAITTGAAREFFPALSPDGNTLAFTSGELGHDIIDVPLNESPPRDVIATARGENSPAWAPDGVHFAYVTDRSGSAEIWLRNRMDGSEQRLVDSTIVPGQIEFRDGAISPDGTRLAYRARRAPDSYAIWLSPLTGGVPVPLWNDPAQSPQRGPSWSPDGQWIAYYGLRDSKPAILKVRVGTNAPSEFIATMATYWPVRWSPRSDWIAFRDGEVLKVVSPDGTHSRVISQHVWETYGWSKDGAALYGIVSDANRRLILATVDVDSAREQQIADLGVIPPAFDLAENFNEFPYRGFSLHPSGTSFLTSVWRAKMQIYLIKDFGQVRP